MVREMKRRIVGIVLLVALIFFITACKDSRRSVNSNTDEFLLSENKKTLTLAGIGIRNSDITNIVAEFNSSDSQYQIKLNDYGDFAETTEQAEVALKTAVLSGNMADMICFENISPLPFIASEALMDMDVLFCDDERIKESDILIWKALHEYGGVYIIAPTFKIDTICCSQETFDDHKNWTVSEYLQMERELDPGQDMIYYMDLEEFITGIGSRYLREKMDIKNATCDLDDEEFIELLKGAVQAKEYKTEFDPTTGVPQRIVDGSLICCYVELADASKIAFDRYRGGETLAYIGWPTVDGSGGTDVGLQYPIGISAVTEYTDGCWEFVKFLLKRGASLTSTPGIPTYAPLLMEHMEILNGDEEIPWKVEYADIEIIETLAKNSETMTFYDKNAIEIVLDEASRILKKEETPEDAAKAIQARVNLFMQEQYG